MATGTIKNGYPLEYDIVNNSMFYDSAVFSKNGNIAQIFIRGLDGLTAKTSNTISGVVPSKYRPWYDTRIFVSVAVGTSSFEIYNINFKQNGDIVVYPYEDVVAQHNVGCSITWICA